MNRVFARLIRATIVPVVVLAGCQTSIRSALLFIPDAPAAGSTIVSVDGVPTVFVRGAQADVSVGLKEAEYPVERELHIWIKNKSDRPLTVDQGLFTCAAVKSGGERTDVDVVEIDHQYIPGRAGYSFGTPGQPGYSFSPGSPGGMTTVVGGRAIQKTDLLPGQDADAVLALAHDKAGHFEKRGDTEVWVGESVARYEVSLPLGGEVISFSFRVEKESEQDTRGAVAGFPEAGRVTRVPRGTIRLEGSISDWAGIRPIMVDDSTDAEPPSADLRAVYLAFDDLHVFLRIDVGDPGDMVGYAVAMGVSTSFDFALEAYNRGYGWQARAINYDAAAGAQTMFSQGTCRWSGSSLEVMLPRDTEIKERLGRRDTFTVSAWAGIPVSVRVTMQSPAMDPPVRDPDYRIVDRIPPAAIRP